MTKSAPRISAIWQKVGSQFLPFADAATTELPLGRLLRLSLFQVSVGMAMVLLTGTLNRVMIVELNVPAWLVGLMVSIPVLAAPFRALIGFKSDTHKSVLGWRRVPYIWFGTLAQFGGFAILPFALLALSDGAVGNRLYGEIGAALAFLMVGAGLHTVQTAGMALATDIAPAHVRPRVVALLSVMLLVGMVASSLVFSVLLRTYSELYLIQIIQGAAMVTFILNGIALWQQEPRNRERAMAQDEDPDFRTAFAMFANVKGFKRMLVAIALGTAGFAMQDILLEPFGGQIFNLSVGQTTLLTATMSVGTLIAFFLSERMLNYGRDPVRIAAVGVVAGLVAFAAIIFAPSINSLLLFQSGAFVIGFGGGLFSVGLLTATMNLASGGMSGILLGTWGGVQATAAGLAVAFSGSLRDTMSALAQKGSLGPALDGVGTGYVFVYLIEIALLFATLIAVGPLVGAGTKRRLRQPASHMGSVTQADGLKEA